MILRNAAVRYGRRSLASPIPRSCLRRLSTEVTTEPEASEATDAPVEQWTMAKSAIAPPKIVSASRKKQRLVQDGILSLGTDSAHEHKSVAWTRHHPTSSLAAATPAEQYAEFRRIQQNTRSLGSKIDKRYVPTELISNPPGPEDVTLELLMASQTHLGHHTSHWNPANSRYIYGVRQGVHIISLETTAAHLRRAARVVEDVSYRGGLILFVGTRKGQMEIVTKSAELAGACHLFTKWTPGGITNRDVILKMAGMKVVDHKDQEIEGFEKFKGVARPLMPDLVVCLNPLENYTLLYECGLKSIPTIGVIDTNVDPSWVTYTIPANDDSLRAMAVVGGVLGRAGQAGQQRRLRDATKGKVLWENPEDLARHMQKETKAAIAERKAVMGRMQQNLEGFTEEEQNILRSQNEVEDLQVSETEMLEMLGEAASGGAQEETVSKETTLSVDESAADAEEMITSTIASIEEQMAALTQQASKIEAYLGTTGAQQGESEITAQLASIEQQMASFQEQATEIEANLGKTGTQQSESEVTAQLASIEQQMASLQEQATEIEAGLKQTGEQK